MRPTRPESGEGVLGLSAPTRGLTVWGSPGRLPREGCPAASAAAAAIQAGAGPQRSRQVPGLHHSTRGGRSSARTDISVAQWQSRVSLRPSNRRRLPGRTWSSNQWENSRSDGAGRRTASLARPALRTDRAKGGRANPGDTRWAWDGQPLHRPKLRPRRRPHTPRPADAAPRVLRDPGRPPGGGDRAAEPPTSRSRYAGVAGTRSAWGRGLES